MTKIKLVLFLPETNEKDIENNYKKDFSYIEDLSLNGSYFSYRERLNTFLSSERYATIYTFDERCLEYITSYKLTRFEKQYEFVLSNGIVEYTLHEAVGRELRDSHNLRKMFVAGAFSDKFEK
jgi:hypothetical protein